MVDGHLQVQGEGVADLFDEDGEKLLVEVIKEELEVRATVSSATVPGVASPGESGGRDALVGGEENVKYSATSATVTIDVYH